MLDNIFIYERVWFYRRILGIPWIEDVCKEEVLRKYEERYFLLRIINNPLMHLRIFDEEKTF